MTGQGDLGPTPVCSQHSPGQYTPCRNTASQDPAGALIQVLSEKWKVKPAVLSCAWTSATHRPGCTVFGSPITGWAWLNTPLNRGSIDMTFQSHPAGAGILPKIPLPVSPQGTPHQFDSTITATTRLQRRSDPEYHRQLELVPLPQVSVEDFGGAGEGGGGWHKALAGGVGASGRKQVRSAPHMHILVCICSNVRQFH